MRERDASFSAIFVLVVLAHVGVIGWMLMGTKGCEKGLNTLMASGDGGKPTFDLFRLNLTLSDQAEGGKPSPVQADAAGFSEAGGAGVASASQAEYVEPASRLTLPIPARPARVSARASANPVGVMTPLAPDEPERGREVARASAEEDTRKREAEERRRDREQREAEASLAAAERERERQRDARKRQNQREAATEEARRLAAQREKERAKAEAEAARQLAAQREKERAKAEAEAARQLAAQREKEREKAEAEAARQLAAQREKERVKAEAEEARQLAVQREKERVKAVAEDARRLAAQREKERQAEEARQLAAQQREKERVDSKRIEKARVVGASPPTDAPVAKAVVKPNVIGAGTAAAAGSPPIVPATPAGSASGKPALADMGAYRATVQKMIRNRWTIPRGILVEDHPEVLVRINRGGKVVYSRNNRKSGVPELDRSAINAVRIGSQLIPLPPGYDKDLYEVTVKFQVD